MVFFKHTFNFKILFCFEVVLAIADQPHLCRYHEIYTNRNHYKQTKKTFIEYFLYGKFMNKFFQRKIFNVDKILDTDTLHPTLE